jgi:hypothetical protein
LSNSAVILKSIGYIQSSIVNRQYSIQMIFNPNDSQSFEDG